MQVSCCPFCLTGVARLDGTHLCSPLALAETVLAWTDTTVNVRRTGPFGGGRRQTAVMLKDIKNYKTVRKQVSLILLLTGNIVARVDFTLVNCGNQHIFFMLHGNTSVSCETITSFKAMTTLAHPSYLPSNL